MIPSRFALVVAALAVWSMSGDRAVRAEEPPAPKPVRVVTNRFDNWTVTCNYVTSDPKERALCSAALQLTRKSDNRTIASWIIAREAGDRPHSVLVVPTGIDVTRGITIRLDDKVDYKVPLSTCEPTVCTASIDLPAPFSTDLQSAEKARIHIVGSNGKPLDIDFPVTGFKPSWAMMIKG